MQNTAKQNYPSLVAFYDTRQETRRAYSTMLPSLHEALTNLVLQLHPSMLCHCCYINNLTWS